MIWQQAVRLMSLEEKIGQMLCTYVTNEHEVFDMACNGLIGALYTYTPGTTVNEAVLWINERQKQAKYPLLLCEDFEEGVNRYGTWLPSFMAIGATSSAECAFQAGKVIGRELKALGYGLVGSPVVDVNTNPNNPIINTRSFGSNPEQVSELALAFIRAVEKEGITATCKHFPGHGDSSIDSHRELAVLRHKMSRMMAVELLPYIRAIESGLNAIMTSHLAFPAVESDERLPATLSKNVLTSLLRHKMDFNGLILSDAMEMHAIKKNFSSEEWAALAINAGIDLLIVSYPMEAHSAIKKGVLSGRIPLSKINQAVNRIACIKDKVLSRSCYPIDPAGAASVIGCSEHKKIAEKIAHESITCLDDAINLIELGRKGENVLLVTLSNVDRVVEGQTLHYRVGSSPSHKAISGTEEIPGECVRSDASLLFARYLRERLGNQLNVIHYSGQDEGWLMEKTRDADCLVLLISVINQSYNPNSGKLPDRQKQMAETLLKRARKSIIVSAGNPYVVSDLIAQACTILTYCLCPASLQAVIKGLAGEIKFIGKLPVTLH